MATLKDVQRRYTAVRKSSWTGLGLPWACCSATTGERGCYHMSQDSYKSTRSVCTAEQYKNRFFNPFCFVHESNLSDFYLFKDWAKFASLASVTVLTPGTLWFYL